MTRISILFGVISVTIAGAQSLEQAVRALRPDNVSHGETAVLDNLERRARQTLAAIPRAYTGKQADRARPALRKKLERSLGFRQLPWPPNLEARTVGAVQRDGYRIEKIVYQTLPEIQVPAHLYIPDGLKARAPAILFYTGHWWTDSKARPDFQAFHINMARLGFVVLVFDAFGQGERGVSRRDHRRTPALLVGISQQGFAEYETQCALEYLLSRKEVDPKRIGMTGASGGGYNTWMTAALDDRISVAVPVVGTSDFYEQIHVTRPLDWYKANEHCHFVANLIRYANNHELLAMIAPRPLMIIAAHKDQSFAIGGVREVHRYGRQLYDSYGIPEKVGFFEDSSTGHGYQQKKREAAYGWFLKWLMNRGDGSPYPEPPTETVPWDSAEMRCFPEGKNQPAGPGMIEAVRRMAKDLPRPEALPKLESVLGVLPPTPPFEPQIQKAAVQRLEIPSEAKIEIPAFLLRPEGSERGVLVAVDDRGKEELASDPLVREMLEEGWAVCGADPRGIGELATTKKGWIAAVSVLLGENFVWRQAFDLRNTMGYLAASSEYSGKPFGLYARGHNAGLAAVYAIAQHSRDPISRWSVLLRWFILRDGFLSYRQFIERPQSLRASFELLPEDRGRTGTHDREIPFQYFVFDALRSFDLPQLLDSTSAKGVVVNPIDGDWNRLSAAEARKLLPSSLQIVSEESPQKEIERFLSGL
jgi:dienelactone hydrolase